MKKIFGFLIAVFLAANALADTNTITGAQIRDNTIADNDIANGTIQSLQIAERTIVDNDIANGTIQSLQIAANTITDNDISNGAITSAEIVNNTIVDNDIANGTIQSLQIAEGTIVKADLATSVLDYGNYTPTITLSGAGTPPQYSTANCRWESYGRLMHVDCDLIGDGGNEGSGTGRIQVSLPVAASASQLGDEQGILGWAFNGSTQYPLIPIVSPSSSVINVFQVNFPLTAWGRSDFTGADQNDTSREFRIQTTYEF